MFWLFSVYQGACDIAVNTAVRVQQASHHPASTPPKMLTWLSGRTRSLVQSGTTSSSKSQSTLQAPVLPRATNATVPVKRWLCPQWLILRPKFMMSSTKVFFFFCPWPFAKNSLTGKDPDAGKDWRQEKGTTEDEMVGCCHQLNGHEFEQAPGVGDGQGSLVCCSPWGHKELDTTEPLNWTDFPYCEQETYNPIPVFPTSTWHPILGAIKLTTPWALLKKNKKCWK